MKAEVKVVVLGGGTGTYVMLQALRSLPVHLTAILTMVDDGGSNRVVRDQFGLLPTSGICQAISALSDEEPVLRELFNYRFHQGEGISGMRFGNLFLAAVSDIVGSQEQAIQETCRLLKVQGDVFPVSYDDVRLVATYETGDEVVGEHFIDEPVHKDKRRIIGLRTEPTAHISTQAAQAIAEADFIIMGPGDFYTNTVANFVVAGVPEAVRASSAKKIFFGNLMTKRSETPDYTLKSFLQELDAYFGIEALDAVVVHTPPTFPEEALALYAKDNSIPVEDDVSGDVYEGVTVYRTDLLSTQVHVASVGDTLQRSMLRHDPVKIRAFFEKTFLQDPSA